MCSARREALGVPRRFNQLRAECKRGAVAAQARVRDAAGPGGLERKQALNALTKRLTLRATSLAVLATPRLAKRAYLVALEEISHEGQIAGNDGPLALKQHVLFRQGDFGEEHGRRRRADAEVVLVLRQRFPNARVARRNPPEAQARLQGAPAENRN